MYPTKALVIAMLLGDDSQGVRYVHEKAVLWKDRADLIRIHVREPYVMTYELSTVCAEETRKGGGRDAEGPATENIDRTPTMTCVLVLQWARKYAVEGQFSGAVFFAQLPI